MSRAATPRLYLRAQAFFRTIAGIGSEGPAALDEAYTGL